MSTTGFWIEKLEEAYDSADGSGGDTDTSPDQIGYKHDSFADAMKRKSKRLSTNLPSVKKNTEL